MRLVSRPKSIESLSSEPSVSFDYFESKNITEQEVSFSIVFKVIYVNTNQTFLNK